jgi:hypothetical protein
MKIAASRIILGLLNVALVCGLAAQVFHGTQVDSLKHTPPRTLRTPHVELDAPAAASPNAIQAQAIFYQTRTYYLPPPIQAVQSAPNYRLVGTMTIPQQGSIATLMSNETSARTKLRQGDQLDGWTVASISPTRVTLELDGRTAQIDSHSTAPAMLTENAATERPEGGSQTSRPVTVLGNSSKPFKPLTVFSQPMSGTTNTQSPEPSLRHYYPPPSPR